MKNTLIKCLPLFIFFFLLSACSSDEEDLLKAAREGNSSKIEYLIRHDLDLNSRDQYGMTALHLLAMKGETHLVKLLIENGADPNSKNGIGMTPLFMAAENGNEELSILLISNGARINETDDAGRVPLHIAAQFGNNNIIKLFIANGADPERKNLAGKIPSAIAAENAHENTADLLVKIMADLQAAQTAVLNKDYFSAAKNYLNAGLVEKSTKYYILSLRNDDFSIKRKTIIALGKIGTDMALESLKENLPDSDSKTRKTINFILKRHGPEKLKILMVDSGESGRRTIDGILASVGIFTEYSQLNHLKNIPDIYTVIESTLGESEYVLDKLKIPLIKHSSTPPEYAINKNKLNKIRKNEKYDILLTTHSTWYELPIYQRNTFENPPLKMEVEYVYNIYIPALDEENFFTYKFHHEENSELGKEVEKKMARRKTASIWAGKESEVLENMKIYLNRFF
ncbi:ankyrin repeat domain-containing protein [Thermodesulfobacteriota bacterium]